MAVWIFLIPLAAVLSLWMISLWRILFSSSSSIPPSPPPFLSAGSDGGRRKVLLVTAHPDDESMFFAPTILFLKSNGHSVHVLCISQGNADGLGNVRKEELYSACAALNISANHVKVLDHKNLQDGFNEKWEHQTLSKLVEQHIHMWDINLVITFDATGVSGHPNHKDVHHGVRKLLVENPEADIEAWELISMDIFRKYSGPVDIWLSSMSSSPCSKPLLYTLINSKPFRTYQAMAAHKSQFVWYRRFFVLFSSYTYINVLRKL